jgi:FAD/FMN-containing dehydrogenase
MAFPPMRPPPCSLNSTAAQGEGDLRERADQMAAICGRYQLCGDLTIAYDKEQRDQFWKARKALYPTLYRFDPRKKPINFVDDVVVRATAYQRADPLPRNLL